MTALLLGLAAELTRLAETAAVEGFLSVVLLPPVESSSGTIFRTLGK